MNRSILSQLVGPIGSALAMATLTVAVAAPTVPLPRDRAYVGAIALRVDATDIDHQLLQVHEVLPVVAGRLTLLYPQWIPGEHGPTNEVKRLAGLQIGAQGRRLAWTRDASNLHAFHVDVPAGTSSLEIDFQQVLPRGDGGYTPQLSRGMAIMQWQGVVLAPAGYAASRIEVDATLKVPAGWRAASALRPLPAATIADGELRFDRVSLETLVDSPVYAGKHHKRIELDPPGAARPVALDLFAADPASLETAEPQIEAHRNLVRQADKLFGARHYVHYDILLALDDDRPWGGLEHHQSSENQTKGGYFTDWAKTSHVRDLVPHEYTHSWNGKFRRPRDLWAADFNVPTQNSLLWVYEGQTQYWGEVLTARAGLIGLDEARERFAWTAAWLSTTTPGRSWRPLQDTTNDEIIAGRQAPLDWYGWQRFEDYYDEGALIWLDVDARLRQSSGGARSLDDFARAFFGVEDGRVAPLLYDFGEVTRTLSSLQPDDWTTYFRTRLDGVGTSPLGGLERAGWRLGWTDKQSELSKNADAYRERTSFAFSLGFNVDNKSGDVRNVVWDGPAYKAGLGNGLTLLAVDSKAYKPELLRNALDAAKTGTAPIELLLKDGADYRTVRIDYHGGQRYPVLERIEGTPDLLTAILTPR